MIEAYLQHGKWGGPYLTEHVEVKETTNAPVVRSVSGYGSKLPTSYMVRYLGHWRRVYCVTRSNNGTLYIGKNPTTGIVVNIVIL